MDAPRRWVLLGRLWRGFFCLLVLPLTLIVVTGGSAAAEVYTTPEVGATILVGGPSKGFGPMECEGIVSVVYVTPTATQPGSASPALDDWVCSGGPDRSPFSCQPAEQGCPYKAWIKGTFCGGSLEGDLEESEFDGLGTVSGSFSGSYYAGDHRCDPASVCVRAEGSGSFRQGCTPVMLDPPGVGDLNTDGACQYGTLVKPRVDAPRLLVGGNRQRASLAKFRGTFSSSPPWGGWIPYVVVLGTDGLTVAWGGINQADTPNTVMNAQVGTPGPPGYLQLGRAQWLPTANGTPQDLERDTAMSARKTWVSGVDPDVGGTVIGAGYIGLTEGSSWFNLPQTNSTGQIGVTDPVKCSFYWGVKIAVTTADDRDEPLGPMGDPTVPTIPDETIPQTPSDCADGSDSCVQPEEEGCDFSLLDPTTWLEGGMCVVASGFGELIDAISSLVKKLGELIAGFADLASSIVTGIINGLETFLKPPDNLFAGSKETLENTVEASNVSQWEQQYDNAFGTGAGGSPREGAANPGLIPGGTPTTCGGPSITVPEFMGEAFPSPWRPLDACSGTMAQMAGWSNLFLTVVIAVGGGVKMLEMLMVSIGAAKHTTVLLGHDWGNDHVSRKY